MMSLKTMSNSSLYAPVLICLLAFQLQVII